eukprot:2351677-Amphidinium_carterae.1
MGPGTSQARLRNSSSDRTMGWPSVHHFGTCPSMPGEGPSVRYIFTTPNCTVLVEKGAQPSYPLAWPWKTYLRCKLATLGLDSGFKEFALHAPGLP